MWTLFSLPVLAIGIELASRAPGDCKWLEGDSGDFLTCPENYYLDGTCESGSRDECRFEAGLRTVAFGIRWYNRLNKKSFMFIFILVVQRQFLSMWAKLDNVHG